MKIALCIIGHYRNFDSCYSSLQYYIIDRYPCDIFVHSYKTKSFYDDKSFKQSNNPIVSEDYKVLKCREIILENEYQTKEEKDVNVKIEVVKKLFSSKMPGRLIFQLYYLKKRIKALARISDAYDFIIMVRPDLLILENFDLVFDRINVIETSSELDGTSINPLYRDDFIAGPAKEIKLLFEQIYAKCGVRMDNNTVITCPHKVLRQTLPKNVYIHKNLKFALLKNDERLARAKHAYFL